MDIPLSEKQIRNIEDNLQEKLGPRGLLRDCRIIIAELLVYRAGKIAPPGKCIVDEADLRALVACAAHHCPDCLYSNEFNYGEQATCDGDLTRGQCIAALQDCLGLPPETEVPQ